MKGEETKFAICVSSIKYSVNVDEETQHHELLVKAWSVQLTGPCSGVIVTHSIFAH